jgi:hypothetical protein
VTGPPAGNHESGDWASRAIDCATIRASALADGLEAYMPDEEWIKTLEDGRSVKFIYQELPQDGAFLTAQIAGNEVVYSVLLTKTTTPLTREDVEIRFKAELSKK